MSTEAWCQADNCYRALIPIKLSRPHIQLGKFLSTTVKTLGLLFVYVWRDMPYDPTHVEVRGQAAGVVLLPPCCSGAHAQVSRLGVRKLLYACGATSLAACVDFCLK